MRNSLITRMRRGGLRRLKSIALFSFTALHLYTFTPVVNAQWGATVPNPIMEYHYTYDNNGNITKIEDKVNGTGYNQSFTYDEVDRLSSAIGPYGSQTYSYDAVGNTQDITPPVTNTYDNGNIIDYNGKHIDYDYENRPIRITNSNNNTITEFAYDYSGQRVYTKVSSGTITSEDYYVGNIYEESYSADSSNPIISASTTTVTYAYADSIRVAGLVSQTTATGTENNTCYYHGDHLGSSSSITDGSGTVVRNISYQSWGNVQSNTEESGASTLDPKHKFTGQILDDSTDLYYYGARYYDPTLRRFITPDTIVQSPYDPQSLNRYAYTRNNPLKYIDPSGHEVVQAETGGDYDIFSSYYFKTGNPFLDYTFVGAFNELRNFSAFSLNLGSNAYESAKQAVFGNSFTEALLGNYNSQAVDAFAFLYGGPLFSAISSAATYSKAALGAKLGELAVGGEGYLANTRGAVGTPQRAFWSGSEDARIAAENWANINNGTTLEMTDKGKALIETTRNMDWSKAKPLWEQASREFALSTDGTAQVFHSSKGVNIQSIWHQTEYNILKSNPGVQLEYNVVMPNGSVIKVGR